MHVEADPRYTHLTYSAAQEAMTKVAIHQCLRALLEDLRDGKLQVDWKKEGKFKGNAKFKGSEKALTEGALVLWRKNDADVEQKQKIQARENRARKCLV